MARVPNASPHRQELILKTTKAFLNRDEFGGSPAFIELVGGEIGTDNL